MVLTEQNEDDDLAQLLMEAENELLHDPVTSTTAPALLEASSFGDDLVKGTTSSPTGTPTKATSPVPSTSKQSNGFSDVLNRSAAARGEDEKITNGYLMIQILT